MLLKILQFIWQLPQNVFGLIVLLVNVRSHSKCSIAGIDYFKVKHCFDAGVSLGKFIFIDGDRQVTENTVKHEHGHQVQSMRFGPLYLLIVGLPSAVRNVYHRIAHRKWESLKKGEWYYSHWPENNADELGNVKRFYNI